MSLADLREAVTLLDEAISKAEDPKGRKRWRRRRWALRARLRAWEDLPRRVARVHGTNGDGSRTVDRERIASTPKKVRLQLAKAELLVVLTVLAEEYLDTDAAQIAAVYGLDAAEVAEVSAEILAELQRRAERAGASRTWW